MATKAKKPIVKRGPKTIKEQRFVNAVLEGKSATKAVYEAGYNVKNYHVAENIASENLGKLGVRDLMEQRERLRTEALLDRLEHGLYESKSVHGTKDDFIEYEDTGKMHKFLETAFKISGALKDQTNNIQVNVQPIVPVKAG